MFKDTTRDRILGNELLSDDDFQTLRETGDETREMLLQAVRLLHFALPVASKGLTRNGTRFAWLWRLAWNLHMQTPCRRNFQTSGIKFAGRCKNRAKLS